jgi:hypothetical protein
MPFALVIDGVVDTVSFEDHSNDEAWIEVADNVFGGFLHREDGSFSPPPNESELPLVGDYENAIQDLVDNTARKRQFRDGVTLASYTASTKPKWAAEAQAFVAWRDNVWFYAYGELAKVQAGQRPQPTVEQFLSEIAPIAW